ncbi:MAG: hypothetical protein M1821_003979 [Bathelium mastoideum]|nr:MAG: hypothetical protein M1821_003979 [Bathelium mastoideum]
MATTFLLLYCFVLLLTHSANAAPEQPAQESTNELVDKLYRARVDNWEHFQKGVAVLRSVGPRGSCHRHTLDSVVDFCPGIKPSDVPLEESAYNLVDQIEHGEVVYAIKLALCEIESAAVLTPPACDIFHTIGQGKSETESKGSFFGLFGRIVSTSAGVTAQQISPKQVTACKNALYEGTPQGWNTYMEFRPRIDDLCKASRGMVDMNFKLDIHTRMMDDLKEATKEATDALNESLANFELALQKKAEFETAIAELRAKLIEDMQADQDSILTIFDDFGAAAYNIGSTIKATFFDLAKEANGSQVAVRNLRGALEDVNASLVPPIYNGLEHVMMQIDLMSIKMANISMQQDNIAQRLTETSDALESLNSSFLGLWEKATAISESYLRLQRSFSRGLGYLSSIPIYVGISAFVFLAFIAVSGGSSLPTRLKDEYIMSYRYASDQGDRNSNAHGSI